MEDSKTIERLLDEEKWSEARKVIRQCLREEPDSHWLLTRLGLTYYEERKYKKALECEERALAIAPRCPLVLWDYAGSLQMLERYEEAIQVYRGLIRRGVQRIAHGECGEGLAWARGLVADCWYRLGQSYDHLGDRHAGLKALEKHLDLRGPGCRSIYPLADLREELTRMKRRPSKAGH